MLELETKIPLTLKNIQSKNLASLLSDEDLETLGNWVIDGYERDLASCENWARRMQAAMDLAMQMSKPKNFPWPQCSNIAFPLVTIAIMQFHARAYPALINGPNVAKCRVVGDDPKGEEKQRAYRISSHMSYQFLEEDTSCEEQHDRLLINVACVGSAFIKSFHKLHNRSELVMAKDLVMDYFSKSVEDSPRKTHIIPLFRNDIYERVRRGEFLDVLDEPWYTTLNESIAIHELSEDHRHGLVKPDPDETTPFITLEQHVSIDLDQDGYAEPYIVTVEENSKTVLRMVLRFNLEEDIEYNEKHEVISIQAREYFTPYTLIPSPDGGIYGLGFGILLGPLNESVNTLINQLIDAGTMSNLGGGFLGRGAKIRGGDYTFNPGEMKRIDSTGDDIRKSIFMLPPRDPSTVLFQLLSLIIQYTQRISGSTDILSGENPGQNTPAQTSQSMIEQGQKIYSAIFKRLWLSMKQEFKKLFILNSIFLPRSYPTNFGEAGLKVYREDYLINPDRVVPAADPNITSEAEALRRAMTIKQAAMTTPGYNLVEVERDFLQALHVDSIDRLYPGPDKVPPLPNPKVQVEQMKMQGQQQKHEHEKRMFIAELQEEAKLNQAKIIELQAKAAMEMAQADGTKAGHQIAAFEAAIGARKAHQDVMLKQIELLMKGMENDATRQNAGQGGVGGMANVSAHPTTPQSPASSPGNTEGATS
jgi:chaperonin GroES